MALIEHKDSPAPEGEPGHRSGHGADSLRPHIDSDARRKTRPSPRKPVDRPQHLILVVDDNPAMLYAVSRGLRSEGFMTIEAAEGQEALKLAPSASAVVLDVLLPGMNGLEICRTVRADPVTAMIPVVHVSATLGSKEVQLESEEAGADAFLEGPVDPHRLAALLESLLGSAAAK